jgi:hypothetical protein
MQALNRLKRALDDAAKEFANSAAGYPDAPLPEPELRSLSLL